MGASFTTMIVAGAVVSAVGGMFAAEHVPAVNKYGSAERIVPLEQRKTIEKATPCDAETPVESTLEPKEVVIRSSGQALRVSVTSRATGKDDYSVMRSVAVYDEFGKEIAAPQRSAKHAVKPSEAAAEQEFELPEGMPDGHYYVELLTAYAKRGEANPAVDGQRLYIVVTDGEVVVVDPEEWAIHANAVPAEPGEVK